MNLDFKRFQREHFGEYETWFADPELSRHLGPLDQDWLEAVLAQSEWDGVSWAVFHDMEMIAVVESAFDPDRHLPAVITAIATRPDRRRGGLARQFYRRFFQSTSNRIAWNTLLIFRYTIWRGEPVLKKLASLPSRQNLIVLLYRISPFSTGRVEL